MGWHVFILKTAVYHFIQQTAYSNRVAALIKTINWNQPLLLIFPIAAIGILLAATSYLFFNDAANRIIEIAAKEDRTSASILAHDLANSLTNKLEGVHQNVQIIAQVPSVQEGSIEKVKTILEITQQTSDDLTDYYGWSDKYGKTRWTSIASENSGNPQFIAEDNGDRDWFIKTRDTKEGYASSVETSPDGIDRFVISYPIIDSEKGSFEGVIYAGVPLSKVNDYLARQLYSGKEITTGAIDMNGIILQAKYSNLVGMNYFSNEYQNAVVGTGERVNESERLQGFIGSALTNPSSGPDVADFSNVEQTTSIAYSYIKMGSKNFAIVVVRVPHEVAADVKALIDQQRFASGSRMIVVGAAAVFIGILVMSWNRKLERTVANRTRALASKTDELLAVNEQLKENDKLQKEFINIAAHELRTPITPILASIDSVELTVNSDGKKKVILSEEYYDMIIRNVKRLERLSSEILQAARIGSGTLRLTKEKFDLNRLISGIVVDAMKSIPNEKRDIPIVFEPSHKDEALVVEADQTKLYEVLTNLLQNAVKFTTEGKITVISEKSNVDGGISALVKVQDTGSGIEQDILPRLFQKFASSSSSNTLGGTGLGLYISKSIVEAHGGKIWAENNAEGKGATFCFSIPLPNAL